jgi:hypothetical protein
MENPGFGFRAYRSMAFGATLSSRKIVVCGRGFQPRSSRLESRSHRGNANLLGRVLGVGDFIFVSDFDFRASDFSRQGIL